MIIAVDGYSSTGKSTVAKIIAANLNISYIDTGAMYRAVTLYAIKNSFFTDSILDKTRLIGALDKINISFKNIEGMNTTFLNEENVEKEIRLLEVSNNVSLVASIDKVRAFLVDQQRKMSESISVIMDGRDIGSVVFPEADIKFFLTCSPQTRAYRRYKELIEKGEKVNYEDIEKNINDRDYLDTHREASPLVKVDDAILVDSTTLNIEQVVDFMLEKIYNL